MLIHETEKHKNHKTFNDEMESTVNRTSNIWESGLNNEQVEDYITSPILYYRDNVTFDIIEGGPSGLGYNGM